MLEGENIPDRLFLPEPLQRCSPLHFRFHPPGEPFPPPILAQEPRTSFASLAEPPKAGRILPRHWRGRDQWSTIMSTERKRTRWFGKNKLVPSLFHVVYANKTCHCNSWIAKMSVLLIPRSLTPKNARGSSKESHTGKYIHARLEYQSQLANMSFDENDHRSHSCVNNRIL